MNHKIDHEKQIIRLDPTDCSAEQLKEVIEEIFKESPGYTIQLEKLAPNKPLLNLSVYNPKSAKQYQVNNVRNDLHEIIEKLTIFLDVDLNLETMTGNVVIPYSVLNESIICIDEQEGVYRSPNQENQEGSKK